MVIGAAGPADPAEVWARYVHPARWSQWSPQIRSVDCADEVIAARSTGRVHGPCGIAVPFLVLDVDHDARSWTWQVTVGPATLTLEHDVTARAAEPGTETRLTITGLAPLVLGYVPLARLALGRLVR